jgi:hypothetical protein
MNDANYIGMDVHRATMPVTALNAAVCAGGATQKILRKEQTIRRPAEKRILSTGSDGNGRSKVTCQQFLLHGRAPKPAGL